MTQITSFLNCFTFFYLFASFISIISTVRRRPDTALISLFIRINSKIDLWKLGLLEISVWSLNTFSRISRYQALFSATPFVMFAGRLVGHWVVILAFIAACESVSGAARVAPVITSQPAHFPNVYATPSPIPHEIIFSMGAHHAVVEVELLEDVTGLALCIQRSINTPSDVAVWPSCTYHFSAFNQTKKAIYTFNVTDVEGNVPYYVNLVLQSPGVETASANVYVTLESCQLGQTIAFHHLDQCVPVVPLPNSAVVPFHVSANTASVVEYFTVTAPNNNPDSLVTGMDVHLQLPTSAAWKFYAGANIPPTPKLYDFIATSDDELYKSGSFHISTPSPGVWYLVLVVNNGINNEAYVGNVSAILETATPPQIGRQIETGAKLLLGPSPNLPNRLQNFYASSKDGSLYISLSVLHPKELNLPALPYKLFVAVNAVPGTFNGLIEPGSDIFADWTGCSLPAGNCTKTTVFKMPASGARCTYIISVLPSGNFSTSQFVIWRDAVCPECQRGICQTSPAEFGTCKCPRGWIQIDCAKWGEKSLTPQTIVIIAVMAFFAVFGVVTLIYILYTKRAKLFPSKFGPGASGYDNLNVNSEHTEHNHQADKPEPMED